MAARLLRLRVALLSRPLRRGLRDSLIAGALRVVMLAGAVFFAAAPVFLARDDLQRLARTDIVFGAVMLMGAFVVALCLQRVHLDARSFTQFPFSVTRLALTLLATSVMTWSGIAGLVWCVTFVVMRRDIIEWNALTGGALAITMVSMFVFTRVAGGVNALIAQAARTQTLHRGIGLLVLAAILPVFTLMIVSTMREDGAHQLIDTSNILAWTPFGAGFAMLGSYADGIDPVLIQFGAHVAVVTLLVAASISITTVLMQRIDYPVAGAMRQNSLGWFDFLPHTPAMTIGARSLTYWVRDPRYIVSLVAIPVIPVLIVGILMLAGVDHVQLAAIPLVLMLIMLGWMVHNDVATDSTALWIHLASGIRGIQDRIGRIVPVFVLGIPLLVIGTSVTVLIIGNWQAFPAVFGAGSIAMCASAGISSIMSVLKPYPTTRPGESPFVQPAWHGSGAGLAQTVSLIGPAVLAAPAAWVLLTQPEIGLTESLMILAASLVYSAILLMVGLVIGGALYNRRSSELLAFTQVFD